MNHFKKYIRTGVILCTPWSPDFDMSRVSISLADKEKGSPKVGDMISKNPVDDGDLWLIEKDYFIENFKEVLR